MTDISADGTHRCPQCGAAFQPEASPLGLCPACLLKLGASDPDWKPASPPPLSVAPAVVEPPAPTEPQARGRRLTPWALAVSAALFIVLWAALWRSFPGA